VPADRPPSTLTRPAPHLLKRFHLGQVGNDTIETFLTKGYSLAICCRDCHRLIEWTPPDLVEKFGDRIKLRIADLGARFTCTGEGGCGSHDIAVFPHLYDGPWSWAPPPKGA
jgi:hypothetical protein